MATAQQVEEALSIRAGFPIGELPQLQGIRSAEAKHDLIAVEAGLDALPNVLYQLLLPAQNKGKGLGTQ